MANLRVVVFDVNETLLDLRGLVGRFETALPGALIPLWFSMTLRNTMVATLTRRYAPFHEQGVEALLTLAHTGGAKLTRDQAAHIVAGLEELAPHPDAKPSLERLAREGVRTAALSNSSTTVLTNQIAHAGLGRYFERLISVDEVELFKPAPEVYAHAAQVLGVGVDSMWLVAAHDWDVAGAMATGARGALVNREGSPLSSLLKPPDVAGSDLVSMVDRILADAS